MKSGANVGVMRVGLMGGANLIVHQGIADIIHQVINPLCIFGVIEEIHKIISDCYQAHGLANLLQFTGNPNASDPTLNFGEHEHTIPIYLPSLSLSFSH